jgi:predicted naringenin-chalcone synthase
VPATLWRQEAILERLAQYFPLYRHPHVKQIFLNGDIESRYLAILSDNFGPENTADDLHEVFQKYSVELGSQAAREAMCQAGLGPADIDLIVVATSTGYLCPGLSARLASELNLQRNLRRSDLVGMGCAGAMPALQRASDFVRAYPQKRARRSVFGVLVCRPDDGDGGGQRHLRRRGGGSGGRYLRFTRPETRKF